MGLSSSAAVNYLKCITELLDFRKASGVMGAVLRSFAVTAVYLRRGKDNLSKKKSMECSRNLGLETFIARDSWASVKEMEMVIPFHASNFKRICDKCVGNADRCSISELAFTTRFVATYLFLRVKCARPMTFQYITLLTRP